MTNLPVPVPAQETPGNLITGALWNANVYNGLSYLLSPPIFNGSQTTAQSIASATWTAITIDTESADSYGAHSTTTNASRYTPQTAGWHLVLGGINWVANATSSRRVRIALNGAQVNPWVTTMTETTGGNSTSQMVAAFVYCNGSTDYIEVHGQQNSGGALATVGTGSTLSVLWISR
jgi:hypothetical protein